MKLSKAAARITWSPRLALSRGFLNSRRARAFLICAALTASSFSSLANPPPNDRKIVIADGSIRIGETDLRNEQGVMPYISLAATEKALGKAQNTYRTGDVQIYAWRGIHLIKALQRPAGMIFKFQVWFDDYLDKDTGKRSGKYDRHIQVDGVDIGPDTTFEMIRADLRNKGYATGEDSPGKGHWASKGEITIFTVTGASDKIQRIEVWCKQSDPMN